MTEQNVTNTVSGIDGVVSPPFQELATNTIDEGKSLKVDVKKLPAKTPKKKISAKRKAEKAAKSALKEFKKIIKRELRDTFKVTSLLSFALKHKNIAEYNLEGRISTAYIDCLRRVNNRKNLSLAIKREAILIFDEAVRKLREFTLGTGTDETALVLGKSKKKVSKTEKSLTPKEKKKAKKSPLMKSLDKVKTDLVAIGAMEAVKPAKKAKDKKPKAIKKGKAAQLDNHAASA